MDMSCFGAFFADFPLCNPPKKQGQSDFPFLHPFHSASFSRTPIAPDASRFAGTSAIGVTTLDFLAKVRVAGVPPAPPRLPPTEKRLLRVPRKMPFSAGQRERQHSRSAAQHGRRVTIIHFAKCITRYDTFAARKVPVGPCGEQAVAVEVEEGHEVTFKEKSIKVIGIDDVVLCDSLYCF